MNFEEFTPATGALVFLGAPLAVVGLIWLTVLLLTRAGQRRRTPAADKPREWPPRGVLANEQACVVSRERGGEVHQPAAAAAGSPEGDPCWTVRCTGCRQTYNRDGAMTHFEGSKAATRAALQHDWTLHGSGMLCPGCSRVGLGGQ